MRLCRRPSRVLAHCILLTPLALAACTRVTALEGPPQDLHTVYTKALVAPRQPPILQAKPLTVGPEAPYTPIMQPPQIQRVWVPDQLNSTGDLVSGHWVYLLLERSQWSLETIPPTPPPTLQVPLAPPAGLPAGVARAPVGAPASGRATPAPRARGSRRRPPTPAPPPASASPASTPSVPSAAASAPPTAEPRP